ncbi:nicotinamide-nucleotide adenylyltransferase [Candidatus Nitrosocosmicus arcticus]|nr:nicotinamide-nucleotide adenylyltransferase [Candidatus Nitrosocosmicus arcticus]
MTTNMAAAMIGRFQPFHLGHLELVRQILNENDEIIILIGSSQANYTVKNPFTAGERIWMIRDSLIESKIDMSKVFMINATDDENNARWFSNIRSSTPPFKILYTGNNFVRTLLKKETIIIKKPRLLEENLLKGSVIRKLILENNSKWQDLVSESVKKVFREIAAVERIRSIHQAWMDSPFSEPKKYAE